MPILAEPPDPDPDPGSPDPEAELIAAMAHLDAAGEQARAAFNAWVATRNT